MSEGHKRVRSMVDDPRAYIAGDRRRALVAGELMADRVQGAGLFADISGFTALTEALATELGPQRGAEELVSNLNRILAAIIEDLHRFGGEVIYFSGDAITCWLDGDDGSRAVACALEMQGTMERVGTVVNEDGSTVDLALKAAVAVGPARRFVVGDPDVQLIDVLAGSLIDDLAAAEQVAGKGEIILDESALAALANDVAIGDIRSDGERRFGVATGLRRRVVMVEPRSELEPVAPSEARKWLLPPVYETLATGGAAFIAELRTVFPVFIRFGGIDFDDDPEAVSKLDDFVRRAQLVLDSHGGNLLQLTLGDKGAYLYAVFGSPQAHEDEATRSVSAALELQALADVTAAVSIQIGISTGRVLSGTCGHPLRRTFACLGDPVNLAARLMSEAPARGVLVTDDVAAAADERFLWEQHEPMELKGKSTAITPSLLGGVRSGKVRRHSRYPLPMVGRERELGLIRDWLGAALSGQRRVIGIQADAGLGKSRLVAEVARSIRAAGHRVAFGEAQAFGTNTSHLIWREPWHTLFDIHEASEADIARLEQTLETLTGHAQRAPLLGNLLGLEIPDNELTAAFDPKLRRTSLESLLADVLQAQVAQRPLVIVLEDCQWIDEASLDLLEVLVRESHGLQLLIVVAYRSDIDGRIRKRLLSLPTYEEVILKELTAADMERVIAAKLAQQFGPGVAAAPEVIDFIADRGHGNPFYIEELVNLLRRSRVDIADPASLSELDIPESLQALVLQRIDSLQVFPRRTLKVASVVGREFTEPALPGVYPDLGTLEEVVEYLGMLGDADLVARSRQDDASWLFRHAVVRDVSYESLPFNLRAELHEAAGSFLEGLEVPSIEHNLDLAAHHFWHSENVVKKVEYQRRAGEAAQAAYANSAAIEYFQRLAGIVEESERSEILLKLGEVLELVGDWERAEEVEREALDLAEASGDLGQVAWCQTALAEAARKQGRYPDAEEQLRKAAAGFEDQGDQAGRGRVLHLAGTLAAQQGDLVGARARYEESRLVRTQLGDRAGLASLLSNLGVVAEYEGDMEEARGYHEEALAVRSGIGDLWAIAVSNTNLGMIAVHQGAFAEARDLFEQAMRQNEEVGDSWMVAVGHNNLGNAYRGLGDQATAGSHYAKSAREYLAYGDRWAAAFLLEDVAMLAAADGATIEAIEMVGAADQMREEISTPRSETVAQDLATYVMGADPGLAAEQRTEALVMGRSLGFDAALEAAITFCDRPQSQL